MGRCLFTLEALNTAVRSGDAIAVGCSRGALRSDNPDYADGAGDFVGFDVDLRGADRADGAIGGPDADFLNLVRVTDRNGDDRVRPRMNTRHAGLNPDDPGVPDDVRVSATQRDTLTVYRPSDSVTSGRTIDRLRRDLDIEPPGSAAPSPRGPTRFRPRPRTR